MYNIGVNLIAEWTGSISSQHKNRLDVYAYVQH